MLYFCLVGISWICGRGARCLWKHRMLLCPRALREDLCCSHALWSSLQIQAQTSSFADGDVCWNSGKWTFFCLVTFAGWGWGKEGSSPVREPLQPPVLNVEKTAQLCFPPKCFTGRVLGETWLLATYCNVVCPCWQGFGVHLKQEKWKVAETRMFASSLLCAGRYL